MTRFILITMVSRFGLKRDKATHLRLTPRAPPPTGGLGPGPDMEAARGLTAPICGVPERVPGVELDFARGEGRRAR